MLAVRWYLRFGLSYRDVEELLAERGVEVDHVTIYRWVLRFTPLLADAARPCRQELLHLAISAFDGLHWDA
jgi:transposase, IS6 family